MVVGLCHALDASSQANVAARVVPGILASPFTWTMEGPSCNPYGCRANRLRAPPARRSRAYPLIRGRYDMETNTITATKNKKNKAIAPRKIAPTTASSLRFGLNIEPSGTLASSGRSGS